jgi:predicted transposase YdaD
MGGKVLEYEAKTILQKGRREGEEIGRREGEAIGQRKGKIDIVLELLRDGLLSISEAAKRLDMQEEELKKYL